MIGWMPRKLTIIPLNRPQAAAAIRGSTKAKASASAGCSTPKVDVKMSGARAPASAMTAPTEKIDALGRDDQRHAGGDNGDRCHLADIHEERL